MNRLKTFTVVFTLLSIITFSGCGTEGPIGETGPVGESGPEAKTFNFDLTFNAGDTYAEYQGIQDFQTNDVVLVWIFMDNYGDGDYFTQLPWVAASNSVNYWPEFNENNGNLYVNTTWADGTAGSPWTSSSTFSFKAVVIKSSARIAHPDVNYEDYEAVASTFNLKD